MNGCIWSGVVTLIWVAGTVGILSAADPPQAEISNGQIRARLYLPDAKNGYYRGTRFDWSGVIASLVYKGHDYYGPWFGRVDPAVHDYVDQGTEIVASPCSAISGPVDEFQTGNKGLGWDEAKPGGTFIKIGIGALRKDDANYDHYKLYEVVDPGKWSIRKTAGSVEFTQELTDASLGYGYTYRKTVRLVPGQPVMVLEHSLKNTGRRAIQSSVYNHNFLVLDKRPTGPDFTVSVPYQIQSGRPLDKNFAEIRGNQIVYLKELAAKEIATTPVRGFGDSPKDHVIRIENSKLGAGVKFTGDRPLSNASLWSIRSVISFEPFVAISVEPGAEFTWQTTYEYYTPATAGR